MPGSLNLSALLSSLFTCGDAPTAKRRRRRPKSARTQSWRGTWVVTSAEACQPGALEATGRSSLLPGCELVIAVPVDFLFENGVAGIVVELEDGDGNVEPRRENR